MKKLSFLLILSLLFSISMEAQKKKRGKKKSKEQAYINQVFKNGSEDFEIMTAPEEWQDEPTVVLCQKYYFCVDKQNGFIPEVNGIIRKRVIIQDKSAIDYYSEYYYQDAKETGFEIIKPDGTKEKLDFNDAVEVETEVPSHYQSKYRSGKYYKIAVPNLEVGDIVDYYTKFKDSDQFFSSISQISYDFPVVSQEYVFDINKGYTLYANTFNGAPDLVPVDEYGLNRKGKKTKSSLRYELIDKMRPAQKNERWDYEYLTEPILKIMAIDNWLGIGDKDDPYKTVIKPNTDPSIFKFSNDELIRLFINKTKKHFDIDGLKKMPVEKRVNRIYDFIKYGFLYQTFSEEQQKEFENGSVFPFSNKYNEMRSEIFCAIFKKLLNKNKVEGQLVVVTPKYFGFSEDVVCNFELQYGFYIPTLDTYYWPPNNYSVAGGTNYNMYGATGYRIDASNKKKPRIVDVEFPESKPTDDVRESIINVTITDENKLEISNNTIFLGAAKDNYSPFLLLNSAYAYDDVYEMRKKSSKKKMEIYHGVTEADKDDWRAKRYEKRRQRSEETLQEKAERKYEFIKGWIENEYDVDEITGFDINAFGTESEESELDVTYSFITESYLQKAGPNLILDIGSLIKSQVELKPEEIEKREKPIELGTATTIKNEIIVQIPEGKTVSGIDNLNMNVDNPSGAFISTATQEGNILTVKTEKIYKQEYLPVEKWSELVEMLEAAFTFSQKKVVLK